MLGSRAYFRTLAGLLRAAPRNPLVIAGAPWRSGWVPLLWAAAQALLALMLLLVGGAILLNALLQFQPGTRYFSLPMNPRFGYYDMVGLGCALLYASILLAIASFPLNLLAFSSRWMERRRLEELLLTRLHAREMAIGGVFWAVLVGAVLPAATVVTGGILLFFGEFLGRRADGSDTFSDDLIVYTFLSVSTVLVVPGAAGATLRVWFRLTRHRWRVLLVAPVLCAAYLAAVYFLYLIGYGALDSVGLDDIPSFMIIFSLLLFSLVVGHVVRSAGKFAPSLLIRVVDMEPYRTASFVANSAMRLCSRPVRATVRAAVRRLVDRPWVPSLVAGVAILLVVLAWNGVLRALVPGAFPRVLLIVYSLPALVAFSTAVIVLRRRAHPGIVLVNGHVEGSILRLLFPLHLMILLPLAWLISQFFLQEDLLSVPGLLRVFGALLVLTVWWLVAVGANAAMVAWWIRPRPLWWIPMLLHVSVPICLATLAILDVRSYGRDYGFPDVEHLFLAAWFVAAGLFPLYCSIQWFQRLYESTVMGLPHGEAIRLVGGTIQHVVRGEGELPQGSEEEGAPPQGSL